MAIYPEIIEAIWTDDLARLRKLASDPDTIDPDGRTGLMASAIDSKIEAARILIAAGADLDYQDPGGWTALHFAAQEGALEVGRLLLDGGAQVDSVDSNGNTPLWRATFSYQEDGRFIALLRSFEADPNRKNLSGVSPMDIARSAEGFDLALLTDDLS